MIRHYGDTQQERAYGSGRSVGTNEQIEDADQRIPQFFRAVHLGSKNNSEIKDRQCNIN
jgi:hypothetical protein